MILRPWTKDAEMVNDVEEYYKLTVPRGCLVLDIGAHIGLFALQMYERGAAAVLSVEPEPENAKYHKLNVRVPQHTLVEAAATDRFSTVELYLNPGREKGYHTLVALPGRKSVTVATVPFCWLLASMPAVLKVDVEGAEYSYNWSVMPPSVRSIAIEFHFLDRRAADKAVIEQQLELHGFRRTYEHPGDRTYRLSVYER